MTGLVLLAGETYAASPVRHALTPVPGMTRAEVVVVAHPDPVAVLVLAPGNNGDGGTLVADARWQKFAEEKNLMLAGLSFASEADALDDGTGYYYAAKGSGQLLLDTLDRLAGKPLPILFYGFSAGAHFTSRFLEWKPERVAVWCAYASGYWEEPQPPTIMPPGMVACGEEDWSLGVSLTYFKQGRAIGRPWLWVGIPRSGHVHDSRVGAFARDYFTAVLEGRQGGWVDIEDKTVADENLSRDQPTMAGWLPDMALFPKWKALVTESSFTTKDTRVSQRAQRERD